jgi:TPR repeat protein
MTLRALSRILSSLLLGGLLLAGCALVDQRTFAPAPEAKAQSTAPATAAPPAAVQVDPRAPLVTIEFGGPPPQYEELLRYAIRAADNRDRDVQYDVVAMLPKADDAERGQADAVAVMRSMMLAGVPAARIHLALRADPTLPARQVRVYVR